jgi:hypothetical protein
MKMNRLVMAALIALPVIAVSCVSQQKLNTKKSKTPCEISSLQIPENSFIASGLGKSNNKLMAENKALRNLQEHSISVVLSEIKSCLKLNTSGELSISETAINQLVKLLLFDDSNSFLPPIHCNETIEIEEGYHCQIVCIIDHAYLSKRLAELSKGNSLPQELSKERLQKLSLFYADL